MHCGRRGRIGESRVASLRAGRRRRGRGAASLARIGRAAEDAGFESLCVMDHYYFQVGMIGPPELKMPEGYTVLAFFAGHTSRIELVTSCASAPAGTKRKSRGPGVPFPPLAERFERLEQALRIADQMWRGDERPLAGRHYDWTGRSSPH